MADLMKITLITGASRGLGRDMALHLADIGHDIVLTYLNKKAEAEAVAAEIAAKGRKAAVLQLDVSDAKSFDAFARALSRTLNENFGRSDFDNLINNAGVGVHASIAETSEADFDRMVNIHLKAPFFLTQKLLPLIKDGGRILNISSGLARFTFPGFAAYASMKGGVEVLSRYMAKELGARRITVNTLAPGAIETDFGGGQVRDNKEVNAMVASLTALGRVGLPNDIGSAVAAILSDEAGWINGQRIEASGGMML